MTCETLRILGSGTGRDEKSWGRKEKLMKGGREKERGRGDILG